MSQFIDESQQLGLTHYIFMNELKINLLDFREQMDNLEAIGLIKTFVRHEKSTHFVYELIQPPTAYQFLMILCYQYFYLVRLIKTLSST